MPQLRPFTRCVCKQEIVAWSLTSLNVKQEKDTSKYDKALAQSLDTIRAKAEYVEVGRMCV